MGQGANDAFATAWFLAAIPAPAHDRQEAAEEAPPGVIISVSLDELDDLCGDLLV